MILIHTFAPILSWSSMHGGAITYFVLANRLRYSIAFDCFGPQSIVIGSPSKTKPTQQGNAHFFGTEKKKHRQIHQDSKFIIRFTAIKLKKTVYFAENLSNFHLDINSITKRSLVTSEKCKNEPISYKIPKTKINKKKKWRKNHPHYSHLYKNYMNTNMLLCKLVGWLSCIRIPGQITMIVMNFVVIQ